MDNLTASQLLGWKEAGITSSTCFTKCEHIRLPVLTLRLGHNRIQMNATSERFSSPKTGTVGPDRFKDGAFPGTYWNDSINLGEEVAVNFNAGSTTVKRGVLLLIDVAHSRKLFSLEKKLKITVVKFLPNSLGVYPPVDAGVISCIKAYHRKQLLGHYIDCTLSGEEAKVDVYDAVTYLEKSWRMHVTPTMISNCWRHTNLYRKWPQQLLFDGLPGVGWPPRHLQELNEELAEVSQLLEQLGEYSVKIGLRADMTAQEDIHYEECNGVSTPNDPSEEEISGASLATEDEENEDSEADVPLDMLPPVKYSLVQASLENIETYLRREKEDVTYVLQILRALDNSLASHNRVTVNCRAGDNLLRVAESCGVMIPNVNFCFEGTCCHCEMEVQGGALEVWTPASCWEVCQVGDRADSNENDLVRSCICPVPSGRQMLDVSILSDDAVWGEGVL